MLEIEKTSKVPLVISVLLVVLASFAAGAVVMYFFDPYLPLAYSRAQSGYQRGFDTAKNIVENSPLAAAFMAPADKHVVQGRITAINGDKVILYVASNPFDSQFGNDQEERTVVVGSATKVVTLSLTSEDSSPANLKVGDSIVVVAPDNVNVPQFTASQIQIQPGSAEASVSTAR